MTWFFPSPKKRVRRGPSVPVIPNICYHTNLSGPHRHVTQACMVRVQFEGWKENLRTLHICHLHSLQYPKVKQNCQAEQATLGIFFKSKINRGILETALSGSRVSRGLPIRQVMCVFLVFFV